MVANLLFNKKLNVSLANGATVNVAGQKLDAYKDIPFVRYQLNTIDEDAVKWIASVKKEFNKSVHLVEIPFSIDTIQQIEMILLEDSKIAIYVQFPVNDSMCDNLESLLTGAADYLKVLFTKIDGFILLDRTTILDMNTFRNFMDVCRKVTGLKLKDDFFGLCGSPYSCSPYACLTAVKARALQAKYCSNGEVALPTSNHQDTNVCSCIRHFVVEEDLVGTGAKESAGDSILGAMNAPEPAKKQPSKASTKKNFIPYGKLF